MPCYEIFVYLNNKVTTNKRLALYENKLGCIPDNSIVATKNVVMSQRYYILGCNIALLHRSTLISLSIKCIVRSKLDRLIPIMKTICEIRKKRNDSHVEVSKPQTSWGL